MNRITSKQVVSMMEAVAQVYEQPENLLEFETDEDIEAQFKQAEERKKKQEAERLRKAKEREAADRAAGRASEVRTNDGVNVRYTRQSDGSTRRDGEVATLNGQRVRWKVDRTGKGSWVDKNGNAVTASASQNSNDKTGGNNPPPSNDNPGRSNPPPSNGAPARPSAAASPASAKTFKVGDKQMTKAEINKEYDRLRNSKDPAERNRATQFGKEANAAIFKPNTATTPGGTKFERRAPTSAELKAAQDARAKGLGDEGAAKAAAQVRDKASAATPATRPAATPAARPAATPAAGEGRQALSQASAATPAARPAATPAPRPSSAQQLTGIQQRLQAIRDMRAAAQSRIVAQGGTPATSAAKPKPKVAPPPVPSTTGTSTTPTTRQPLKNGDPMERMTGKGAQSLREAYSNVYEERTEEKVIDEGILDAIKRVGKAVLGPADQSPEAEAARRGARRPQGDIQRRNAIKTQRVLDAEKREKAEDVDLFDVIKGHFIEEGLTEEEALAKMLDLTDEERTEIIEGSCGSMKKKKKSKKGGY